MPRSFWTLTAVRVSIAFLVLATAGLMVGCDEKDEPAPSRPTPCGIQCRTLPR